MKQNSIYLSQVKYCGGYSGDEPPLTIPNREVKLTSADGTAPPGGRVGRCRFSEPRLTMSAGVLFLRQQVQRSKECGRSGRVWGRLSRSRIRWQRIRFPREREARMDAEPDPPDRQTGKTAETKLTGKREYASETKHDLLDRQTKLFFLLLWARDR